MNGHRGKHSAPVVVGISALFHDAAACLLENGTLVAAAEEERFTRIKHDAAIPRHAFEFCLRQAGLTIADVDCIAYYEDPRKKLARQLWMGLPFARVNARLDSTRPEKGIRTLLRYEGPIEIVDHHLSHAASSFYFSGFDESAVMTFDGAGEWATTTYGRADDGGIDLFEEVEFPDSIGLLYSTLTGYLGFEVNEGEYKVMGLAPYGQPRHVDRVRALVEPGAGGQYRLVMKYFDFLHGQRMYSDALCELFGQPARPPESALTAFHMDVARSLQVVLEEFVLEKAHYLHGRVPSENVCLAGGVALNCVANGRLLREGPFRRQFVQPAAGDAGGALGAAAVAHARITGRRVAKEPLRSACLGPETPSAEVYRLLQGTGVSFQDFRGREAELMAEAVERLAAGKIVGWFHGRMEFGPRALGCRSILADPRDPTMRERINALVKKRESFRPFAPAVLESKAAEHFDLAVASPFMLLVCQVTSTLSLPAITHVDGSARVQTVNREQNPRFARLLEEFDRRTGCPILLNTSFNMRGEPIVCTAVDALTCFVRSRLDVLVLGDFMLDRADVPALWYTLADGLGGGGGAGHSVYTLW